MAWDYFNQTHARFWFDMTPPEEQPDRPELLTISVGELAEGLHSLVCHCPRGARCGRMDFHREQAAEAFADIQRQRDTLQGDETEDLSRTYGDE